MHPNPPSHRAIDAAVRSSAGATLPRRPENQDNYLLVDGTGRAQFLLDEDPRECRIAGWPAGHVRAAVLDGMGGHGHGREAAEAAVLGLLDLPPCTDGPELAHRLDQLHARLQQRFAGASEAGRRPGTTLTLLEIAPHGPAMLYHVGDSRLYEIDTRTAVPLTVDHVPATAFAMAGLLGEREWWSQVHGEHRPQITQAFILGNAFGDPAHLCDPLFPLTAARLPSWLAHLPDRRAVDLRPGATYLLATDGFWSCPDAMRWVARWPALLGAAGTAGTAADALFAAIANHPPPGLQADNLTALVLRVSLPEETALPGA